jgi:hypothetical protein
MNHVKKYEKRIELVVESWNFLEALRKIDKKDKDKVNLLQINK